VEAQTCIWPNFYIVGAVKCGTTTLYAELKKHPQVFLPEVKEPHFFTTGPAPAHLELATYVGNQEKYQRLFRDAQGYPAIGDASPSYLWDEKAAGRIHEVSPCARIIIILRDPVVRAHSHFLMARQSGAESEPVFLKALQDEVSRGTTDWHVSRLYVLHGKYFQQVQRYIETFGRESVLVLLFDDLTRQPSQVLASVARHIGVNSDFFETVDLIAAQNAFKMPRSHVAYRLATSPVISKLRKRLLPASVQAWLRSSPLLYGNKKPSLDDESRHLLQEIYDPDISRLEDLLGRRMPELRKSWV
jgi:hypothetical protein